MGGTTSQIWDLLVGKRGGVSAGFWGASREKVGRGLRVSGTKEWEKSFGFLGVTMRYRSRILEARGDNGEGRGRGAWLPDFDVGGHGGEVGGGTSHLAKITEGLLQYLKKGGFCTEIF